MYLASYFAPFENQNFIVERTLETSIFKATAVEEFAAMATVDFYYTLTLNVNSVTLQKCRVKTPANELLGNDPDCEEVAIEHLIANLQDALHYDALDEQLPPHRHQQVLVRRYGARDQTT